MDNEITNEDLVLPAEFPQFLKLPNDLIKKLVNEYFDSLSVLRCLRVCKLLKVIVDKKPIEMVRINVLKQIAYEKQMESIGGARPCEICNQFISMKLMKQHVLKHEGKICRSIRPPVKLKCELCDAPYPDCHPHGKIDCPMKRIACQEFCMHSYNNAYSRYLWAESLCDKKEGFKAEMRDHSCSLYKCKICQAIFSSAIDKESGFNGFALHLRSHNKEQIEKTKLEYGKYIHDNEINYQSIDDVE